MSSITWWNRLEPRPRTPDIIQPLRAHVRDPLWLLTRQWQLGEFLGADSGTPAWVTLTERLAGFTAQQNTDATTTPLQAAPLEHQLLHEPFTPDLATSIELGQILSQLLDEAGSTDSTFRDAYPIAALAKDIFDPVEATLRRVCAGRAFDGVAAYTAMATNDPTRPPAPPAVAAAYMNWVEDTLGPLGRTDAPSWQPARLEYATAVTTTTETGTAVLDVHPGVDGLIDWAAFDLRSTAPGPPAPATTRTVVPIHVRFKGMPNARFWDFEDATLDFGDLKPDKRDLARLALIDFMLVHANDWYMLPLDLPVGSTHQIDLLLVHDVFGTDTLVERADRETPGPGRWTLYSTSIDDTTAAAFFVQPPTAGAALQTGRVVEEVRFARDEMANMAWAIENVLENAAGQPWPQHERDAAAHLNPTPPAGPVAAVALRYQIESAVPGYWLPLLPVSLDPAAGVVALELATGSDPNALRGRVLQPTGVPAPYQLPEEEIPRNGLRVQRLAARSRWTDGSTRLWSFRRVQPGTGETSSGLRFDQTISIQAEG